MEIMARLAGDAKVRTVSGNRQVVGFDVVINDSYKKKGSTEWTKLSTFIQCSYWSGVGVAPYLTKGKVVELNGRIGVDAYTDREGKPKGVITFFVSSIKFHGGGNQPQPAAVNGKQNVRVPDKAGELTEPLDDLPF